MAEPKERQSFWTTLPGILTGLAALLTAGTGLFLALNHPRDAASRPTPPAVSSAVPVSTLEPAANPGTVTPAAAAKESVIVTSRNGEVTHLAVKTFRHSVGGKSIELTSGQTVPFEKIRSIDFENVSNSEAPVHVTLTDGRVLEGSVSTNNLFEGENDIGPFSIYMTNVKQVAFQRTN
jgi:hypothetical protein